MEERSVFTSPHFIDYSWLQIQEYSSRNVLARPSLAEEGVEGVVASSGATRFICWHCPIRLDTMFQTVEFPAGVTDLDASLSKVNRDTLTLRKING